MRRAILAILALAGFALPGASGAASAAEAVFAGRAAAVAAGPDGYASHRHHRMRRHVHGHRHVHRHRWSHRATRSGAIAVGPYIVAWPWNVTHPRWPSCYDRPPFHCPVRPAPVYIPVSALDLAGLPTHREMPAPVTRATIWRDHHHRSVVHRRIVRVKG